MLHLNHLNTILPLQDAPIWLPCHGRKVWLHWSSAGLRDDCQHPEAAQEGQRSLGQPPPAWLAQGEESRPRTVGSLAADALSQLSCSAAILCCIMLSYLRTCGDASPFWNLWDRAIVLNTEVITSEVVLYTSWSWDSRHCPHWRGVLFQGVPSYWGSTVEISSCSRCLIF